ncbi:MAG: hypothetical protein E4H14_11475 [Candidatus Thorarchaeota archaeon]|nr:MAG: hypothetical protein E4H14_11475 [Candidatus Thorarchaeota archaeon]
MIEALAPISKNSPEVYNRILEIAIEIPLLTIDIRSELQFLFDQLLPEDKLRVIRPHIEKFLGKELFFFRTPLAELILIHGNKKDLEILIHSLNTEPWNLGDIWLKNIERSKQIFEKLSNPLAKLLYEIDISGGWDEYKKKLENDTKKAEQDLLLFLDNGRISVCYTYLTSGEVLRKTALKHWKRIFLSDEISKEVRNMYLGDLFDSENDEIVEYVAGEIDRIHQDIKEEEKGEERMHRTSYYSYQLRPFDKIRDRCGYEGFKKLLLKVKDPYAIEGVMTYLVGAAKKEGVPKSEIQSMKEYDKLGKETKWNIIKNYDE